MPLVPSSHVPPNPRTTTHIEESPSSSSHIRSHSQLVTSCATTTLTMPERRSARRYTIHESVILMYFASRGMYYHVIADVIYHIIGSNRPANGLKNLALRVRQKELETCPFYLYDNASNIWSLELVDYWLVHQLPLQEVQSLIRIDQELWDVIARVTKSQRFPLSLLILWFRDRTRWTLKEAIWISVSETACERKRLIVEGKSRWRNSRHSHVNTYCQVR